MHWSKLKQRIEEFFSPTIRGRVELHSTWYRQGGRSSSRLWITIDGNEVYQFSSLKTAMAEMRLAYGIAEANSAKADTTDKFRDSLRKGADEAGPILEKQGLYTFEQAHSALEKYISIPLEEALQSDNLITRSLAILDRRLGKRRLLTLQLKAEEHPLIERLYAFRCAVEKFRPETKGQ